MTRTASSVGMSAANAPKHLKAGSVEGLETAARVLREAADQEARFFEIQYPGCGMRNSAMDAQATVAEAVLALVRLSLTLEGEG